MSGNQSSRKILKGLRKETKQNKNINFSPLELVFKKVTRSVPKVRNQNWWGKGCKWDRPLLWDGGSGARTPGPPGDRDSASLPDCASPTLPLTPRYHVVILLSRFPFTLFGTTEESMWNFGCMEKRGHNQVFNYLFGMMAVLAVKSENPADFLFSQWVRVVSPSQSQFCCQGTLVRYWIRNWLLRQTVSLTHFFSLIEFIWPLRKHGIFIIWKSKVHVELKVRQALSKFLLLCPPRWTQVIQNLGPEELLEMT